MQYNLDPAAGGIKADTHKNHGYALIPPSAIGALAKVLELGADKYGPWNWRKGMPYSRVLNSAHRHLAAWTDGEDLDPESGQSHIAHAAANLIFLLTYLTEHPECDDRYKRPA